jgi:hypothetical protein
MAIVHKTGSHLGVAGHRRGACLGLGNVPHPMFQRCGKRPKRKCPGFMQSQAVDALSELAAKRLLQRPRAVIARRRSRVGMTEVGLQHIGWHLTLDGPGGVRMPQPVQ